MDKSPWKDGQLLSIRRGVLECLRSGLPEIKHDYPMDFRQAIQGAGERWPRWAALPFKQRLALTRRLVASLSDCLEELSARLIKETGRPWWLAIMEVKEAIGILERSFEQLEDLDPSLMEEIHGMGTRATSPQGVWSIYPDPSCPLFLTVVLACTALLGGNAVLICVKKAWRWAPLYFCSMVSKCGLPPGICAYIAVDRWDEQSNQLKRRGPNPDGVFACGPPASLRGLVPRGIDLVSVRVNLMVLGGASVIVWGVSDPAEVAREVFTWSFAHMGLVPGSPRLVICKEDQIEALIAALQEGLSHLRPCQPQDKEALLGRPSSLDEGQYERWITMAKGRREFRLYVPRGGFEGLPYPPTIFSVPANAKALRWDVPMGCLAVVGVSKLELAFGIARARQDPFLGLYADEISDMRVFPSDLRARGVFVNAFPGPFTLAMAGLGATHGKGIGLLSAFMRLQERFIAG